MSGVHRGVPGGHLVRFYDLRYVYPNSRRLPLRASVELDANLEPVAQFWGDEEQEEVPFWAE